MNSTISILPSRPIHPHIPATCTAQLPASSSSSSRTCNTQLEFPIPSPPPKDGTVLNVQCWKCGNVFGYTYASSSGSQPGHRPAGSRASSGMGSMGGGVGNASGGAGGNGAASRKGRKIGTQERPLETGYYDILGVPITASTDDIKKAYRRLAIKHHPDKNPSDPDAASRFQAIAIAYQTLSDPALRKKYNEFGPKESAPEGGFVDPEEVFGAIFGGERFISIIGHISLAGDMKSALQEAEDGEDGETSESSGPVKKDEKGREILSPEEKARREEKARVKAERERKRSEEKAKIRAERVNKLVENLEMKLSIYTESATGRDQDDVEVRRSWRDICQLEAEDLKSESYGLELLHTIGFVYLSKAKHHLASTQTLWGVGGWLHNVQGKVHVFSETVSTLRAAIELKAVFDQIQAAEQAGNLSPEEKRRLEEQAAEKGLQALFKGTKLEIESILREVCSRILEDPVVPPQKAHLRAVALQILGEAYIGVVGQGGSILGQQGAPGMGGDEEYVRVETKNSRARSFGQGHANQGSRGR